ncbi:NaeI family type II restriction endonuclease [Streptomyces sp. NPDC056883]|uniref:NaeI family type II restriction endonuclease n=1 Tax=Streptomyces sp. NPDC056883 TaxID=3345959 RepID=UPI0036A85A9F
MSEAAGYSSLSDRALQDVAKWFLNQKGFEGKFQDAIRTSLDEVFDGKRTGRYRIDDLTKTEKTYIGTKIEIVIQDTFSIQGGQPKKLDYLILGHEVDCKFTIGTTWEIPREAVGKICLLVRVSEEKESFSVGLLRTRTEFLTGASNSDGKKKVSAAGKRHIQWISNGAHFPKTLLLTLPEDKIKHIFKENSSGQDRINTFLELAQGVLIDGETLDTVSQQRDGMARLREGEGRARTVLRDQGILIAGHWQKHKGVLQQLEVPLPRMPRRGEIVSFRVVKAQPEHGERPRATLDKEAWVLATPDDLKEPGPRLPSVKKKP